MSKVRYAREPFGAFIDEALPLLARHHDEVESYPDIPLDIDRERYQAVEDAGNLRIFTARVPYHVGSGSEHGAQLIGYAVFCVSPSAHSRSSLQAVQDVVYLDPEYRRGAIGISLLRYAEAHLAAEGVQAVYHYVKRKHPALGEILARLGYEHIEMTFAKRLDARG